MATNLWRGGAPVFSQVWSGTVGSPVVANTYILTVTDDNGATAAVSFAVTAAETTAALLATAVAAAWNASRDPLCRVAIATTNSDAVILTASIPGCPFSVAASGTGSWSSTGDTTASSGPYDAGCAANWTLGVPVGGQDLVFPAGTGSILYGLDFHSVTFATIRVDGIAAFIGRYGVPLSSEAPAAPLHYFRCACTGLTINGGAGLVAFDVGSSAIAVTINASGLPDNGFDDLVVIKGSALTTVSKTGSGSAGVATYPGDTATITGGAYCTGGTLRLGLGCTVSGTVAEVANVGSIIDSWVSVPTVTVRPYSTFIQRAGTATTCSVHEGGTYRMDASGTYTTVNQYPDSIVDASFSLAAKTITTRNRWGDVTVIDPGRHITVTTDNAYSGSVDVRETNETTART